MPCDLDGMGLWRGRNRLNDGAGFDLLFRFGLGLGLRQSVGEGAADDEYQYGQPYSHVFEYSLAELERSLLCSQIITFRKIEILE